MILALALSAGGPAGADVWDDANNDDDSITTQNRLVHGALQVHDLAAPGGVADLDFFRLELSGYASYEAVVEGYTGDLNFLANDVVRTDNTGAVVQTASLENFTMPLRWKTPQQGNFITNYIRVRSSSCVAGCSTSDEYTIRFRETTYVIPRFNNSATQQTFLIVNALGWSACSADFLFFNVNGNYLGTHTQSFNPTSMVLNTSALPFAAGQSGVIRVLHTCPYGTLTGKAVALEPATGFTFDTQMVPVPY